MLLLLKQLGLLLGAGTLGDRIGHRRMFLIGLSAFGAASLVAAFSQSAGQLIGARAALAVGAAAMMPATLALIGLTFHEERERNIAIAIWGSVAIIGAALGPIIGGLLLARFWWGSVFLVNVPVVVLAFTRLHAGGKFDKREGNSAYAFSGGLHGVGVSVTNALSTRIEVEVRREGKIHRIDFADGGETISPVRIEGDCGRQTGTRVRVWPDGKYFESPRVPMNELERLLRSKAVLLSGVAVRLDIEQASGPVLTKTWTYPEGLAGYLKELAGDVEPVAPIFTADKYAGKDDPTFAAGEGAAWALAWFESRGVDLRSLDPQGQDALAWARWGHQKATEDWLLARPPAR